MGMRPSIVCVLVISYSAEIKQEMDSQVDLKSEAIRRRPPPIAADRLPAGWVYIRKTIQDSFCQLATDRSLPVNTMSRWQYR